MERTAARRAFANILVSTLVANVTTSFLWFALTFWVYIETRSVLATGIIGGAYMLFVALFAMVFGTVVDRHRKHAVMVLSSVVSAVAFGAAGALYLVFTEGELLDLGGPWFWVFAVVILFGGVIEFPGDQSLLRAVDRVPGNGMDVGHRDRRDGGELRASAPHPGSRDRARSRPGLVEGPRSPRQRARDPRGTGPVRSHRLLDLQQPYRRRGRCTSSACGCT